MMPALDNLKMGQVPTPGNSVVILSGGMDSATALWFTRNYLHGSPVALSFDYGQRHAKELACAAVLAQRLHIEFHIINLREVGMLIPDSALTNPSGRVPEGHYAEESMKQTVVPNRNAMMLNIAVAVAVARHARYVVTGVHAGDHAVYPDCRPEFIEQATKLARIANEGFIHPDFEIYAPFMHATKADIVRLGEDLLVPWQNTWTCYKGKALHCGRCSTCVERLEAFDDAGVTDRVKYEDTEYWKEVVAQHDTADEG
jgi:7-cyano-7-deazaguanine synthase